MRRSSASFGLLVLAAALVAGLSSASAEFFGCNDKQGQVVGYGGHAVSRSSSRTTHEFAAQSRPRITIVPRPGPNSKRHCQSWLVTEYRVSGTVIVPKMRCWWD
jgi:hypothetical protein